MFVLRLCDLSSFTLSLMYNYAVHCRCGFSIPGVAICMLIAFSFLIIRAMKVFYNLFKYWEIRQFYITALKIESVSIADIDVARLCSFILQLLVTCMFSVRAGFHSITPGWPNASMSGLMRLLGEGCTKFWINSCWAILNFWNRYDILIWNLYF